uniref:charged multivesicular body protein 7 isoform X2 n=1 Tax=Pristiophorus japonicus TaxID=55135 RepID=UPI00398E4DA5
MAEQAPVPEELCPDWSDDQRMAFLFSAFKQNREVNCSDWDSKLGFWTARILEAAARRRTVSFRPRELRAWFRRKGSEPLGLGTVLQDMARRGLIQKESGFAASVETGWLAWGVGLLLIKPLKWTLSSVLGNNTISPDESFVIVERIKIVKFSHSNNKVSTVTEIDVGVHQLVKCEKMLTQKAETLSQEADGYKEEARSHLKTGKKHLALKSLKMKRRTDKRLENIHAKLDTIQTILDRIYTSQTDKTVVEAYQTGLGALRRSMKDVTVEKVENLMDQIEQFCETQDDINQTLASANLDPMGGVDTDELEAELNALLESAAEITLPLPDVPTRPLPGSPSLKLGAAEVMDAELEARLHKLTLSETCSLEEGEQVSKPVLAS